MFCFTWRETVERFTIENVFGAPTELVAIPIPPAALTEPFRLLHGIRPELIACYSIAIERTGHPLAEVVTYGCPEGIMFRLTLVGAGMRRDLWERVMPPGASIGDMVAMYWRDPAVLAVRG